MTMVAMATDDSGICFQGHFFRCSQNSVYPILDILYQFTHFVVATLELIHQVWEIFMGIFGVHMSTVLGVPVPKRLGTRDQRHLDFFS